MLKIELKYNKTALKRITNLIYKPKASSNNIKDVLGSSVTLPQKIGVLIEVDIKRHVKKSSIYKPRTSSNDIKNVLGSTIVCQNMNFLG